MRFLKPLLGICLSISILFNVVLYAKYRGHRPVFSVNGQPVSRGEMYGYLEQQYGPAYKAMMTERIMMDQEAHAQGVAPTDQELKDEFARRKEMHWAYA